MGVRRYDSVGQARFLTFSCYRRAGLLSDPLTRDAFVEHLEAQRVRLGFDVIAWVVMPEHVHAVVVPRDGELGPVLRGVKQGFGRKMIRRWRDRDHSVLEKLTDSDGIVRFWQRGGGYDRNVRDLDELREKVNYIHQNPEKRGLVERSEDWVWSSARDYLGESGVIEIRKRW
jgi:REP-associated tyrosine transposase